MLRLCSKHGRADDRISYGRSLNDTEASVDVSDGPINQDLWIDGFACALTGKPARRVPMRFLWVLGSVGEVLRLTGLRFPMDMARYFRMTTSAAPDMEPTFEIVGQPKVPLAQGIKETVAWLEQARPDFFGAQRPAPSQ